MVDTTNEYIVKQIRNLRRKHKLSPAEFGRMIDTSKQVINWIESNKLKCCEIRQSIICEVFNLEPDFFIPKSGTKRAKSKGGSRYV